MRKSHQALRRLDFGFFIHVWRLFAVADAAIKRSTFAQRIVIEDPSVPKKKGCLVKKSPLERRTF